MKPETTQHPPRPLRVFLSHASLEQDKEHATKLHQQLQRDGIESWCASLSLIGGQHVEHTTLQTLSTSDVCIVCISQAATTSTGPFQKEITQMLHIALEQPEGTISVIPVKLDACQLPQSLEQWHPINLYEDNGYDKLMTSLLLRAKQVNAVIDARTPAYHDNERAVQSERENPLQPARENPMPDFQLTFTNREEEQATIKRYIEHNFFVQIHAPAGLGKTWILGKIKQDMHKQGWTTVWMDFDRTHRTCTADRRQFLAEFAHQVGITLPANLPLFTDNQILLTIARDLTNHERILFFLDNADRGDHRMLQWIRAGFLETLSTQWKIPIGIIATCQQPIPEWSGYGQGRPFKQVLLQGFNDPLVLGNIIEDVAQRFGANSVQQRMQTSEWTKDLHVMVNGLRHLTCEHPLAIERVLKYAVEHNGLIQSTFFTDYYAELCLNCLSPIVGERILPSLDRVVREAFRVLCTFRYVWGDLIRLLTQDTSDLWEPFNTQQGKWGIWWSMLQNAYLISDVEASLLYPLSPIARQIITRVLCYEEPELYHRRHLFARQAYEHLLTSNSVAPQQRARSLIEYWYHMTQESRVSSTETATTLKQTTLDLLDKFSTNMNRIEYASQLRQWLREDAELREHVTRTVDADIYEWALDHVEQHITTWKEGNDDE